MNFCGFRRFNVNPSGAPRQLPLHKGAMSRCDFRLCATEKTNAEFKFSKLKVCTLFLSGSAVRQPLPSSERKVSRASVTKGACEIENDEKPKNSHSPWLKTQSLHIFFLWHCSASTVAFLREEGVTHKRDERSLRD